MESSNPAIFHFIINCPMKNITSLCDKLGSIGLHVGSRYLNPIQALDTVLLMNANLL